MDQQLYSLYVKKLDGFTVFRSLTQTPLMQELKALLCSVSQQQPDVSRYSAFVSVLFETDPNFSTALRTLVLENENPYLYAAAANKPVSSCIADAAKQELAFLSTLSSLTSAAIKACFDADIAAFLPDWETTPFDFTSLYETHLTEVPTKGYGIYAKYHTFTYGEDGLQPIKHPDPQQLSQLTGYERERGIVLRNTEALLQNGTPSNLLLYGDAGTGKSSTIKAVANALKDQGLRLIEVKKNQLYHLPQLLEMISENPLKFIIFIDDLSFTGNDEHFASLKATLEGSVAACASNTVIYATSNRRHLVKETLSERDGDELHTNDTLQELMSLSARFGMTITFLKPNKDEYLSIVSHLAEEYGLDMPQEELFIKAEAFAIRQNGRSPRTAKHFVQTQLAGL